MNPNENVEPKKGFSIGQFILNHYRHVEYIKSPEQIASEEYLVPGLVRFKRWYLLPAAVILQFCCGSLYAWSVYNTLIDTYIFGYDAKVAPITFYIAVGFFGFSTAVMGPWLERRGPRASGLIGSVLFYIGNLLTALAIYTKQIWLVFVGYGVIGGFGLGLCYITPVSALQKFFPDKRGLGSGFAVCGFGAGSIATALIPVPLNKVVGLPLVFVIIGSFLFFFMVLASLVLRTPPPNYVVNGLTIDGVKVADINNQTALDPVGDGYELSSDKESQTKVKVISPTTVKLTLLESLGSSEFRLMYIMFFANAIFGLVVISRLSNMVTDIFGQPKDVASEIVSANGGFNLFGRLFFSILSDYVGRKWCYVIMLTLQLIILGSFSTVVEHHAYWPYVVMMWILTACYGGGFGVIPAFLTDMFGPYNIGACHGVILTAWSLAGVGGGLIFTAVFNKLIAEGYTSADPQPYTINVWWIFGVVAVGWLTLFFLRVSVRDRLLPKKAGELLRLGVGPYIVRVYSKPSFKVEFLKRNQLDQEWEAYIASRE